MSDVKKVQLSSQLLPQDIYDIEKVTGNPYLSVVIISKRANQINTMISEELREKLQEFILTTDNLEEVQENAEQIEISKYYERLPKPNIVAHQEFTENKIYYRNPLDETEVDA